MRIDAALTFRKLRHLSRLVRLVFGTDHWLKFGGQRRFWFVIVVPGAKPLCARFHWSPLLTILEGIRTPAESNIVSSAMARFSETMPVMASR
jgi:hypothetical protein